MSKDLRQFLQVTKEAGPDFYVEVSKPLKPKLEPCVIQEKLAKEGRFPVIYCPEIEGSRLPLVTNLFGSYELLALALDMNPKNVHETEVFREFRRRQADIRPPQVVPASEAPVKDVIIKDIDLGLLPIIHHAELDAGKYITVGCMICKDPDTGIPNAGLYRHMVKGKDQLAAEMHPSHHAACIARRHAELAKPMEVAISLGHHPAAVLGALTEGDLHMNELEVMGGFLGEPLQVTSAETVDLPVPALAEIVIEGVIDPCHMTTEGPFAEFTGYYSRDIKTVYLIQVTGITMRKDAIYHDLDNAHREHNLASVLNLESAVYNAVKAVAPGVEAVHFPPSGCCYLHTYISIKKRVQGEGKLAGLAALSAGNYKAKLAVVVDDDVDVYDEEEVLRAIATRVAWDSNVLIMPGVTGNQLDPVAYNETRLERGQMNTKIVIDATKPVGSPFLTRVTPPQGLWESMNLEDYLAK